MKILMAFLFFAAVTVVIVESHAQGRSTSNRPQQARNSRVGRNSVRHGGSIGARGNSAKPRNPPRHIVIRKSIHNKPIHNKQFHNKPVPTLNKPTSNKPALKNLTPNNPTLSKPTPNKPNPNKPTPNKPTPEKSTLIKSIPIKPTPSKPTPNNPTLSKPTPNKPILNNPILNKPILPNIQNNQQKNNKLDLKNTKIDSNSNAEAKNVQTKPASTVQVGKAVDKKSNNAATNAPIFPQKDSNPEAPNDIKDTKGADSVKAQLTVVDGIPGWGVTGTKKFINKNGNKVTVTAGASLQKGSNPEEFVGIKVTNDEGDSLNAKLKMVDDKLGYEVIGKKKIYNKNGVNVSLNAELQKQAGGDHEEKVELEVHIPIG